MDKAKKVRGLSLHLDWGLKGVALVKLVSLWSSFEVTNSIGTARDIEVGLRLILVSLESGLVRLILVIGLVLSGY